MSDFLLAHDVARTLEAAGIEYIFVGSFASNQYAIPRSTKDADFVIDVSPGVIDKLYHIFGDTWNVSDQITFETITGSKKLELHHPRSAFIIELFFLGEDAHHQSRWKRRVQQLIGEELFWFPSAEDVIIQKLRWGRPKDLDDVAAVISLQEKDLNFGYIESWCSEHGTSERLI